MEVEALAGEQLWWRGDPVKYAEQGSQAREMQRKFHGDGQSLYQASRACCLSV